MNNAFNLYELKGFKAVGSDIVTPWIDDLLDKKNTAETGRQAQILSYPVDKLLTPETGLNAVSTSSAFPARTPDKVFDIHIASSVNKDVPVVSPDSSFKPKIDLEKEVSYITFVSKNSFYAMPALNINEIIKYKTPVNIFSRKTGHLGVISYRNRIVPIYDFSAVVNGVMDIKALLKYTIICIYENKFFGLSVSEIKNITGVKNKNLIASSSFKFKNTNNITSHVFEDAEGKFYSVADIESIFKYLTS
jgi:chemotaxis signal transduction protein